MGEKTELIEDFIKDLFPDLSDDIAFCVTSDKDPRYNCIAWAFGLNKDRWMQFDTRPQLDGVYYWWPKGVRVSPSVFAYIDAFKTNGFETCESGELEDGFVKIALYVLNGTENCSHASRQKIDGTWMSKLGGYHDIVHGTPYSIVGDHYGTVHTFMKRSRR